MLGDKFAFIANYLWKMSIDNINTVLSTDQVGSFNMNDYYYLTVISQLENPNLGDVANKLKLTKPAISALVQRLIKNGLAEKIQSSEDKRVYHIALTEKGRKIIQGDDALYRNMADNLEKILSKEQLSDFDCLLTLLINEISDGQKADGNMPKTHRDGEAY